MVIGQFLGKLQHRKSKKTRNKKTRKITQANLLFLDPDDIIAKILSIVVGSLLIKITR